MNERLATASPFSNAHWGAFVAIPHQAQGAVGSAPAAWAKSCGLDAIPDATLLPEQPLTRQQVRDICLDPARPVLFGFVSAMAWGGQSKPNAKRAWKSRESLRINLERLRAGGLTRAQAFDLFAGKNWISGLGPAYFSKLLYFFSPKPTNYIMDQWTARSVNLITGRKVVLMAGDYVSGYSTGKHYQAFCEEIDAMAVALGCSGQDIEERLFSQGGRKPWPWRAYVKRHG